MADDTQGKEGQEPTEPVEPQEGTEEGQEPQGQVTPEEIKKLRSEAASWRVKYQNAQKQLETHEQGKLTDMEKLERERDKAIQERDEAVSKLREAQVVSLAAKHQAKYPDAVARLVPEDAEDVEAAVKQLRKDYPDMFRTVSADGGAGTQNGAGAGGQPNMNTLIRQAAGKG